MKIQHDEKTRLRSVSTTSSRMVQKNKYRYNVVIEEYNI